MFFYFVSIEKPSKIDFFDIKCGLAAQGIQKTPTAQGYVLPGGLKVTCVPGVSHTTVDFGIFKEVMDLPLGVLPHPAAKMTLIFFVHDYEKVEFIVVIGGDEPCPVVGEGDSVFGQGLSCPPVHSVTDFVIVSGG